MELRIISSEIIKPSSPTPHDLKIHKLSCMDQLNLDNYFGYVLIYKRADTSIIEISDHLKKSLSKTLTHYYPFAGRVKDDYFIDCDDSGIPFIEAHLAIPVSEVLRKPDMNILEQLMPYNPNSEKVKSNQVILAVQLNYFDSGGIAICVCFRHVVADGSAAANFLKNWSAVAGGGCDINDVIFDISSIFPPNQFATNIIRNAIETKSSVNCIAKRFTFDGTKIASLKETINNESGFCPTRFEIVSALIWGALISMARKSGDASPFILIPVNVRKRMNPPFPQQCIGNAIYWVTGNCLDNNEAIDYGGLAKKIHQFVNMANDDAVRKYYNGDAFEIRLKEEAEGFTNDVTKINVFSITSLCRAPIYEVDFGWGKPTWANILLKLINVVSFVDSTDGKGIEAWVGLSEKNMENFEEDPGILSYTF